MCMQANKKQAYAVVFHVVSVRLLQTAPAWMNGGLTTWIRHDDNRSHLMYKIRLWSPVSRWKYIKKREITWCSRRPYAFASVGLMPERISIKIWLLKGTTRANIGFVAGDVHFAGQSCPLVAIHVVQHRGKHVYLSRWSVILYICTWTYTLTEHVCECQHEHVQFTVDFKFDLSLSLSP